MLKISARIISVIFHPLIMPSAGILMLLNSGTYLEFLTFPQKRVIFLIIFLGTAVLPLSLIPVMLLHRQIGNIQMNNHRERVIPLLITVVFYLFTWYLISRINTPGLITTYTITAGITVIICALVSLKWKISLHMTAMGALAGVFLAVVFKFDVNLQFYLIMIFLAGGLTGWSRLTLKAHSPLQVYTGFLSGAATGFLIMFFF
jgi:membrane-associated phospholipid phosphatase